MRGMRPGMAALVVGSLLACSGDGGGPSLAMDELGGRRGDCPVPIGDAASAAGLGPAEPAGGDGATDAGVEVDVEVGVGGAGRDASAIDQLGGTFVTCRLPVGVGEGRAEVTVELFASDQGGALRLFLPQLVQDLGVTAEEAEELARRIEAADIGEPANLGTDGDAEAAPVAVARVEVDGAESAVLYVSATEPVTRADVRAITEGLLDPA